MLHTPARRFLALTPECLAMFLEITGVPDRDRAMVEQHAEIGMCSRGVFATHQPFAIPSVGVHRQSKYGTSAYTRMIVAFYDRT